MPETTTSVTTVTGDGTTVSTTTTTVTTVSTVVDQKHGLVYTPYYDELSVYSCDTSFKELIIPESFDGKKITNITDQAFKDSHAEKIVLPETVTYLQDRMFAGLKELKEVSYSSKITYIPSYCFDDCTSLTTLPTDSITGISTGAFRNCASLNIGKWDQVTYISDYAFMNCTSLTEFTLPPQVTSLYTQCFAGCTSLKTFNMNSTVNYMNNKVFEGCTSLESISLPRSCTSISENAFKVLSAIVPH